LNITLVALYNVHSYAIRGLHALLAQKPNINVKSVYFKTTTYTTYDRPEIDGLLDTIEYTKPDVIGFQVFSPIFPLFKVISEMTRKRFPSVQIIVGGAHPTADPESCLDYADYVIVGEGEKFDLSDKGIIYGKPLTEEELNELPISHYGLGCYYYGADTTQKKISYTCSRGCLYNCSYCHESVTPDRGLRKKSPQKVIDDIKELRTKSPNIRVVSFSDSIFPYDDDWLDEFGDQFVRMNMVGRISTNANVMNEDRLRWLQFIRITKVRFGVQSGSEELRKNVFNRKDSLGKILELATFCDKIGIQHEYDFIINNPYDTHDSMKDTRDFISKLPYGALINYFELRWFPGTPLTKRALDDGYIRKEDVEGQFNRFGNWAYSYIRTK